MVLGQTVGLLICHVTGTYQGQDHWEKYQAMEQAEDDYKEEHLEEDHEGVVVRGGQQNHSQEGGEAAVEDCWTNLEQSVLDPGI